MFSLVPTHPQPEKKWSLISKLNLPYEGFIKYSTILCSLGIFNSRSIKKIICSVNSKMSLSFSLNCLFRSQVLSVVYQTVLFPNQWNQLSGVFFLKVLLGIALLNI